MPFGGLLTGGLVAGGLASSAIGSSKTTGAQQNIAQAQLQQQGAERQFAVGAAQPTGAELDAMQKQLQNYQETYGLQKAQLQKDISLESLTNPELQRLLKGEAAPTLNPYMAVVQNQRDQLSADLSRQLGSGWENTTAGMQALQQFNLQHSNQAAQIQQQYLGSMMANNLALGSSVSGQINQGAQTLAGLNQGTFGMSNAIQGRQISASEGTSMVPYSGANNISQLGQGQMMGQLGGSLMGAGTNLGTLAAYQSIIKQSQNNGLNTGVNG